jgi:hypothetical protein
MFPVFTALLPLMFHKEGVWIIATILIGGFVLFGVRSACGAPTVRSGRRKSARPIVGHSGVDAKC